MKPESKLRTVLVLLLVVVGLLAGATPAMAQDEEEDGWLEGLLEGVVVKMVEVVEDTITHMICSFRAACMNAVGYWFCIQCGYSEGGEGGPGGSWGCGEVDGCECMLCVDWLGEYKTYISDGIGWVAGTTTVFSKFIPWELWSTLFTAYITAAGALFAMRIILRLGMMMFGAVLPG